MDSDISAFGWLVILCALALGFGLVKFLIVTVTAKAGDAASQTAGEDPRHTGQQRPKSDDSQRQRDDASQAHADNTKRRTEESRGPNERTSREESSTASAPPRPWHQVLGVSSDASWDVVRAAYKKKMAQYHPDKVAGLGPEFSVVAEAMTKEIAVAYDTARALNAKA
jgi:hypothetical protein